MAAFYNEIDPKAAAWLRELIKAGHIADGEVDERDIQDIRPADISGFTQCHFFAGIGVWSYALRCAGWPDDRPVWTGSCPCQPFSAAGKGGGFDDERHLWPTFHWLIEQCRPPVVLGEQVASKDGLGWLDLVQADLEGSGYASGAVDTCAAGFGAPHIRQRLYWIGERLDNPSSPRHFGQIIGTESDTRDEARLRLSGAGRSTRGVADTAEPGWLARGRDSGSGDGRGSARLEPGRLCDVGGLAVTDDPERRPDIPSGHDGGRPDTGRSKGAGHVGIGGSDGGLADADCQRQHEQHVRLWEGCAEADVSEAARSGSVDRFGGHRPDQSHVGPFHPSAQSGPTNGLWRDADWLFCRDGKWRPVEPGTFPLAHGAPERVGRLRGYGNAIVAPAAQAFIEAYLETEAVRAAA